MGIEPVTTAAICTYPTRAADGKHYIDSFNGSLPVACVVAGFPAGQGIVRCTLADIDYAAESGADEIDIVINRTLVLYGKVRGCILTSNAAVTAIPPS